MYLRDTVFPTLGDVTADLGDRRSTWSGSSTSVRVRLTDGTEEPDSPMAEEGTHRVGTIILGEGDRAREVPANQASLNVLARFYEVPFKFLERLPVDEQEYILDHRIQRTEDKPLVVKYTDRGIYEAYLGSQERVDPQRIAEGLMTFMPEESLVIDWWNTPEEFRLDVVVPEGYDRGIGGDAKINDLTHGGVRVGQNRARNLAPWTQTLMFRLACTNGMEVPDYGIKVEARRADALDIEAMLISEARRAFDRVTDDIAAFYDLRSVKADDDFTGLFRRLSREQDLPERTIGNMENTLPDALLAEDEVTMWHLVNHMTNQANNPQVRAKPNAARQLQIAGGQLITEHAARCAACHSRLS